MRLALGPILVTAIDQEGRAVFLPKTFARLMISPQLSSSELVVWSHPLANESQKQSQISWRAKSRCHSHTKRFPCVRDHNTLWNALVSNQLRNYFGSVCFNEGVIGWHVPEQIWYLSLVQVVPTNQYFRIDVKSLLHLFSFSWPNYLKWRKEKRMLEVGYKLHEG